MTRCVWAVTVVAAVVWTSCAEAGGRKIAVLVGVEKYKHRGWSDLGGAPVQDVIETAKVLRLHGWTVIVLTRPEDTIRDGIHATIEWALSGQAADGTSAAPLGNGDYLWVQLCGHGDEGRNRIPGPGPSRGSYDLQSHFCGSDALPAGRAYPEQTRVSLYQLIDRVREPARQGLRSVFVFDCCRGLADKPRPGYEEVGFVIPDNTCVLQACGEGQSAENLLALRHGLLSLAVKRSLTGEDTVIDGRLTWDGLVVDVKRQFTEPNGFIRARSATAPCPITRSGAVSVIPLVNRRKKTVDVVADRPPVANKMRPTSSDEAEETAAPTAPDVMSLTRGFKWVRVKRFSAGTALTIGVTQFDQLRGGVGTHTGLGADGNLVSVRPGSGFELSASDESLTRLLVTVTCAGNVSVASPTQTAWDSGRYSFLPDPATSERRPSRFRIYVK